MVDEDTVLSIDDPGVLEYDSDGDLHSLTVIISSEPLNGSLVLDSDGSFSYTPNQNFNGLDTFSLVANDGLDDSEPVTVEITVLPVNDDPVAVDDEYRTKKNTSLNVPATIGVIANDYDIDGDSMEVGLVKPPSFGNLQLFADGSFIYKPETDFEGSVTFTYRLIAYPSSEKAAWTDEATVTIQVIDSGFYIYLPLILK